MLANLRHRRHDIALGGVGQTDCLTALVLGAAGLTGPLPASDN